MTKFEVMTTLIHSYTCGHTQIAGAHIRTDDIATCVVALTGASLTWAPYSMTWLMGFRISHHNAVMSHRSGGNTGVDRSL